MPPPWGHGELERTNYVSFGCSSRRTPLPDIAREAPPSQARPREDRNAVGAIPNLRDRIESGLQRGRLTEDTWMAYNSEESGHPAGRSIFSIDIIRSLLYLNFACIQFITLAGKGWFFHPKASSMTIGECDKDQDMGHRHGNPPLEMGTVSREQPPGVLLRRWSVCSGTFTFGYGAPHGDGRSWWPVSAEIPREPERLSQGDHDRRICDGAPDAGRLRFRQTPPQTSWKNARYPSGEPP
jgi:hypothetical protein